MFHRNSEKIKSYIFSNKVNVTVLCANYFLTYPFLPVLLGAWPGSVLEVIYSTVGDGKSLFINRSWHRFRPITDYQSFATTTTFAYPRASSCWLYTVKKKIDSSELFGCVIPNLHTLILDEIFVSNPLSTKSFLRAHPGIERLELGRGVDGNWFENFLKLECCQT